MVDRYKDLIKYFENGEHKDIFNALDSDPALIDVTHLNGKTLLHLAVLQNNVELLNKLLYRKPENVNIRSTNGCAPIHVAAQFGYIDCVKSLLLHNADVNLQNTCGETALFLVSGKSKDIMMILLDHGADVNIQEFETSMSPLHVVSILGCVYSMELLLKKDVNVNILDEDQRSPLHYAAKNGNADCLNMLVSNNAQINLKDVDGLTPLHLAAAKGHLKCVEFLLQHKADPSITNETQQTPLHHAAMHGYVECVNCLLNVHSNCDMPDEDGYSPLHLAIQNNHLLCIQKLLEYNANVDLQDSEGFTHLHRASASGNVQVVQLLLKFNANRTLTNKNGHIPYDCACLLSYDKSNLHFIQTQLNPSSKFIQLD